MFGDFFGDGDDIVEDMIILDMLECGNCRNTCTCGRRPVQRGYGGPVRQVRLGCGRCYGQCSCAGYDDLGNLIRAEMEVNLIEDITDDLGGGW